MLTLGGYGKPKSTISTPEFCEMKHSAATWLSFFYLHFIH